MKTLTVNEAIKLVKSKPAPAVSIYLKTDVPEKDSESKLKLNLQRLYKSAEALITKTYDLKTRERLLQPLKKALTMLGLRRSKGGIGIYHSEHFTGVVKLPTVTNDLAVAADSFHIKPVLRCVQSRKSYFVLALKKKWAELVLVTADGAKIVDKIDLAGSYERSPPNDRANRNGPSDGLKIRRQRNLKRAMATLNRQLESIWQGERIPLVIAGPHDQQAAFRECCSYLNVLDRGISGPVDDFDLDELTNLSLNVIEVYFDAVDNRTLVTYFKAQAAGMTSTNLKEISKAAALGQISHLFVAEDRQIWGHLCRVTGDIDVLEEAGQEPADDLLDDLAELTINKGGQATVLPTYRMPGNALIAAVLRWSDSSATLSATTQIGKDMSMFQQRKENAQSCA